MADDQQFCLRWNNHQSTLISVFDTLLENGTLVDCTLAAEGQSLKAHKVVLSACSPYLETLLSEHYEKHPIIIMKDVKFTELKSMMDYMYRGEVNICQDQLGTFLKAAESLQIKGLSENGEGDARDVGSTTTRPPPPKRPPATPAARTDPEQPPAASPAHRPRDGSISPSSRKRRRTRRNSDDANHFDSNSCDLPLTPAQSTPVVPIIPASITSTPIRTPVVKPEINDRLDHNSLPPESGLLKEKIEPAEQLLEPKTEYLEDLNNDDSVEDLTLDDDDEMDMSQMSNMSNMSRPGPSHGTDISNQGFSPWQLGNQSGGNDEVFMAAQEAVNSHRDSQDSDSEEEGFDCLICEQAFPSQARLLAHFRQVGQNSKAKDFCSLCDYHFKTPEDLAEHLELLHPYEDMSSIYVCRDCGDKFSTEEDAICHSKVCSKDKPISEGKKSKELTRKTEKENKSPNKLKTVQNCGVEVAQEGAKEKVENGEAVKSNMEVIQAKVYVQALKSGDESQSSDESKEVESRRVEMSLEEENEEIVDDVETVSEDLQEKQNNQAKRNLLTTKTIQAIKVIKPKGDIQVIKRIQSKSKALSRIFKFFNTSNLEELKKGYKCPDCHKTYTTHVGATEHLKNTCNMEPSHACHICDYRTSYKSNLRAHIRLKHEGPDSYMCEQCGQNFDNKRSFTHHTNYDCVAPRQCHLCDFKTKYPGKLNTHMLRTHSQLEGVVRDIKHPSEGVFRSVKIEIPDPIKIPEGYKCPKCKSHFKITENYKKHYKYSCGKPRSLDCLIEFCPYKTNNFHNMKQHMKRIHCLFTKVKQDKLVLVEKEEFESETFVGDE